MAYYIDGILCFMVDFYQLSVDVNICDDETDIDFMIVVNKHVYIL